jgi:hypothetical protein
MVWFGIPRSTDFRGCPSHGFLLLVTGSPLRPLAREQRGPTPRSRLVHLRLGPVVVHHVEDFVERRTISWFNGAIAKRQAISTAHWERTLKATVVVDLPDGGDEFTSAGMKWSDVPEHARYKAAWIDGRHGPTRARLPTIEIEPVPDILHRLPSLHDDRPRGSKAMFDAGGANAVCAVRVPVRGSSVRTRDGNGRCGRTARSVGCPLSWNCPPTCSSRHAMMFSKRAIIGAGARS